MTSLKGFLDSAGFIVAAVFVVAIVVSCDVLISTPVPPFSPTKQRGPKKLVKKELTLRDIYIYILFCSLDFCLLLAEL